MTADNLNIKIPREIINLAGIPDDEIESSSIEIWVNELYSEGKISVSKASQLLNLSVDQFLDEFRKKRIIRIGGPQSVEEAIEDYNNLDDVLKENSE